MRYQRTLSETNLDKKAQSAIIILISLPWEEVVGKLDYNFRWSAPYAGAPIVSIASYGFTFNSSVIEMLGQPRKILIGYDDSLKTIGIKPIDDDSDTRAYDFIKKERRGYIRISNRDFIKYIAASSGISFEKAIRYIATWDVDNEVLLLKLDEPMDGKNQGKDET